MIKLSLLSSMKLTLGSFEYFLEVGLVNFLVQKGGLN